MKRMLIASAVVLAMSVMPVSISGVFAEGDAACDGANGGVDTALAAAVPGAGPNVPAGQVDFVISTVTDSNPEVPAGGCP